MTAAGPDDRRRWILSTDFQRTPPYQTLRAYQAARHAAVGGKKTGGARQGGRAGWPRFRAYRQDKEASIAWQVQSGSDKAYARDLIDRAGQRVKLSRQFGWQLWRDDGRVLDRALAHDARVDTMRLCRDQEGSRDRWYVTFDVTYSAPTAAPAHGIVGLDRGVTAPVATSDGQEFGHEMLARTRKLEKRRRRYQRHMARQLRAAAAQAGALTETGAYKRGVRIPRSNRFKRVAARASRVQRRCARIRDDWAATTAAAIIETNGVVAIEALRTSNMTASAAGTSEAPGTGVAAKRGLNREILGRAWGHSNTAWRMPQCAASASLCGSNRLTRAKRARPAAMSMPRVAKIKKYRCTACGHTADADVNAACVIRSRALYEVGPHRSEPAEPADARGGTKDEGVSSPSPARRSAKPPVGECSSDGDHAGERSPGGNHPKINTLQPAVDNTDGRVGGLCGPLRRVLAKGGYTPRQYASREPPRRKG